MTRCGHLQRDNDHIDIDDEDTRDSRVVTQRYSQPTQVLVITLLGVGIDGGWLLCWRRARLLCWLVVCVLIPGLPFR